jgi:hypothetical protein
VIGPVWSCGAVVLVVEQDESGGDDPADAPGAASVAAQCLEGGFEQGVRAFTQAAHGAVDSVVALLVDGEFTVAGVLNGIVKMSGSPW